MSCFLYYSYNPSLCLLCFFHEFYFYLLMCFKYLCSVVILLYQIGAFLPADSMWRLDVTSRTKCVFTETWIDVSKANHISSYILSPWIFYTIPVLITTSSVFFPKSSRSFSHSGQYSTSLLYVVEVAVGPYRTYWLSFVQMLLKRSPTPFLQFYIVHMLIGVERNW